MGPQATASIDTTRRTAIMEAAKALFLHYGYRRTSLEEIAKEAGISRTGLYHHFGSKEEIFLAIAEDLYAASQATAEEAANAPLPFAERLRNVLEAKMGYYFSLIHGSRHGAELMDTKHQVTSDLTSEQTGKYSALLTRVFREANDRGEIDLNKREMSPESAAQLIYHSATGLQGSDSQRPTPEEYSRRLDDLVRVTAAGLQPTE